MLVKVNINTLLKELKNNKNKHSKRTESLVYALCIAKNIGLEICEDELPQGRQYYEWNSHRVVMNKGDIGNTKNDTFLLFSLFHEIGHAYNSGRLADAPSFVDEAEATQFAVNIFAKHKLTIPRWIREMYEEYILNILCEEFANGCGIVPNEDEPLIKWNGGLCSFVRIAAK